MLSPPSNPLDQPHPRSFLVLNIFLLALIGALLITKFQLLHTLNINWDEFHFASQIHEFQRGHLEAELQTFHVHLFSWIRSVSGSGIDQILAAREFMFGLRVVTCLCLFAIGWQLYGTTGALVAVIASLAFSYTIIHGESFRPDPIIVTCFLVSALLLVTWPEELAATLAAAILMALSMLISIKSVIYAPSIVLLWATVIAHSSQRVTVLRNAAIFSVTSIAIAVCLLAWHKSSLSTFSSEPISTRLVSTGASMLNAPPKQIFKTTFDWDRSWWILLLLATILSASHAILKNSEQRRTALLVFAMVLPVATLGFYRNSFPYYYVCLVPPAALAIGYLVSLMQEKLSSRQIITAGLIAIGIVLSLSRTVRVVQSNSFDSISPQRHVIAAVTEIFPSPVPYIDRCSMVIDYPKLGIFMSTIMTSLYRENAKPIMQSLVERHQPPFLLQNSPGLFLDLTTSQLSRSPYRLLEADHEYLQRNYIPHWGPIWVAGYTRSIEQDAPKSINIAVAGPYTVEAKKAVRLNGNVVAPGAVLHLSQGPLLVELAEGPTEMVLRYGDHLPLPQFPVPGRHLFSGLGFRTTPLAQHGT